MNYKSTPKMTQDTIDIRGLFKNMQSIGFSTLNHVCEKIDNSISANAKAIKIIAEPETNSLIVCDDGDGMNMDEMRICGMVHRRTDATSIKHGRYGAGGNIADIGITDMGKVHYVSKPKNDNAIYEMPLNYNVVKLEEYKLNPHEASRKTEETLWNKYAINPQSSGTVQIMHSNPKFMKEFIEGIEKNDITESYRFNLGCIYREQLHNGLKLSFQINEKIYNIEPIDRSKYAVISNEKHKQKVIIRACQLADLSYRFYFPDKTTGQSSYRDISKRGKNIKEEVPDKTLYTPLGDIVITSTYNKDWIELTKPDLEKMQINYKFPQDKLKAILGGINVIRNEKQIAQFPSSRTGLSNGLIPYAQNSHHMVAFKASVQMDTLFDVLVNKSNLVEKNIQKDLFSTIEHICDTFVTKMKRLDEPEIPPPVPPPTKTTCCNQVKCVCPVPTGQLPVPKPVPKPVPQPTKTTCCNQNKCICPPKEKVATPKPLPVPQQPQTLCKCCNQVKCNKPIILPPKIETVVVLNHDVVFSKTDTQLIVSHRKKNYNIHIPYVGQYNITEKYYTEILMKLGEQRFLDWIVKSNEMGLFEHNRVYFN